MTALDVERLTGMDVLDELDVLRRIEHEVAIDVLTATARFLCDHREETVDGEQAKLPGRQRAVRLGGARTPKVAEFAPALVSGRLALSAWSGARLCADVLDLEFRLPLLWASLARYEAKAGLARHVARRTRDLSAEQAATVDARVVESADGRLPWGRFATLVEAAVLDADVESARRREQEALTEQFANPTRSTVHGMRGFYVQAPFPVIARIDATVAYLADALAAQGHCGTLDERRVLAVLLMANPAQALGLMRLYRQGRAGRHSEVFETGVRPSSTTVEDEQECSDQGPFSGDTTAPERPARLGDIVDAATLLPDVTLYVHLSDDPTGVARVEDPTGVQAPITAEWVRRWLGPHCRFTIKPVLVPEQQTPVDAWEVPARHREAVHIMSPADVFPWAANTTRRVQIDHTMPYDPHGPPGQSGIGNYGPLTVFHHRLKTHGHWQVAQPFPGIYLWRDPTGATYLVDHSGSRRLRRGTRAVRWCAIRDSNPEPAE